MERFAPIDLTVGILVRTLFVVFIGLYFLLFYKGPRKAVFLALYIGICAYGAVSILLGAYTNGPSVLITNAKMFFKMFYFVFVLLFFYAVYRERKLVVSDKVLLIVYLEYALSIFLSAVTNTSFVTYEHAQGFCGWFYAGNEVGAVVSILVIIALFYVLQGKSRIMRIAVGLLTAFIASYIGTKVPFIACFGAIVLLILFFGGSYLSRRNSADAKKAVQLVALLVVAVLIFQLNSPVKQNNDTMLGQHYQDNVIDKIEDGGSQEKPDPSPGEDPVPPDQEPECPPEASDCPGATLPEEEKEPPSKLYLVANWILSNRLTMIEPAFVAFEQAPLLQKMFGLGYEFLIGDGVRFNPLIEMDFIALLINHGILGLAIYLAVFLWFSVICIKRFFKNIKNFFSMKKEICSIFSIVIAIACAFLAGHVLVAPSVSIYLAIIIINLYSALEENVKPPRPDTEKLLEEPAPKE